MLKVHNMVLSQLRAVYNNLLGESSIPLTVDTGKQMMKQLVNGLSWNLPPRLPRHRPDMG